MTALVAVKVAADRVSSLIAIFIEGRRSAQTKRAYANHLETWVSWCASNGVDPLAARHAQVSLWLAWREREGDSGSTRSARLSAVSSWYRWLIREEVTEKNPASLLPQERPVADPVHTPALSPQQAEKLLLAADADGLVASALIATMLYTGARIGELLGTKLAGIGQEAGQPVLRIVGKGRKRRMLPLIPAVYSRLDRYLVHRWMNRPDAERVLALPGEVAAASSPLFATGTGRGMQPTQVRRILLRCARKAGLEPEVIAMLTPHSSRATFATTSLASGVPLRDVQYALGHGDPRTTEGYDRSQLALDRHPATRLATVIHPPPLDQPE